jgi:hypothetical protein
VSEATRESGGSQYAYRGLPWFDRVWVALLLLLVVTITCRLIF